MTHQTGFSSYPPPGSAPRLPQQPENVGDSGAVKFAKFFGLLAMIAALAVLTALFLVWLTRLLHEWWPAIPSMTFGLAIRIAGLVAAWFAVKAALQQIYQRWLRVSYGPKS